MENLSCTIDLFFLLGPMKVVFQNNLSLQDFTHCTTSKRHGHKQTEICPGSDRSRCVVDCRNVSPNITGSGPNNHVENSEITHPKTKMSHERRGLEDLQPFQDGHFLGNILTFCGGNYRSAVSSHIETLCFFPPRRFLEVNSWKFEKQDHQKAFLMDHDRQYASQAASGCFFFV